MKIPMGLKRVLRRFVPDRVMARYRLAQHSRQVRTNVDVAVLDRRQVRRWLAVTPDTYRIGTDLPAVAPDVVRVGPGEPVPDEAPAVVIARPEVPEERLALAARLLGIPGAAAGVVGRAGPLRLVGRRRVEPDVAPEAVALAPATIAEVGGIPGGSAPLPGLLERLRDAGHRIALAPLAGAGPGAVRRTDPIEDPAVVILSAVPLHDVGGGSRSAQMARELLRRGYHVTAVALYGTAETVDLGLRLVHPRLEQVRADRFDPERYLARVASEPTVAVVEVPAPAFGEPAGILGDAGFRVVYDLIDDWTDPALGGEWYRREAEARFVDEADALVASAPDLVDRLSASGRPARLVANGVDATLFGADPGPRPADFPEGEGPVLGYHGSLYGDWFDWDALERVAAAHPEARVVVIGDDKVEHPAMPGNVHFLGLKPQVALPAYVARFDVGLLPFVVSATTHAVSPLKVFEYLACGVPVAAPPLRSLDGLDGIHRDDDLAAAVAAALAAPRPDAEAALATHSWGSRLTVLFEAAGLELAPVVDSGARILLRPPVHYGKHERRF